MKYTLIALLLFFALTDVQAQNKSADTLIKEGIQFHDQGNYDKAVSTYKKALKIEPDNTWALFEMALTYFHKYEYKKSVKYADKVLKYKNEHTKDAYGIKGNALDEMGKTDKSIELFKKAIKEFPDEHLLHFNLAVNYAKRGQFNAAEYAVLGSIKAKDYHPGSHLLMMNVHNKQGNKIKALLAGYYFLLLEPTGPRSKEPYDLVVASSQKEATQTGENEFALTFDPNLFMRTNKDEFDDLAVNYEVAATISAVESSADGFKDLTKVFIEMFDEKEKSDNIWWNHYIPFFESLHAAGHTEAFTHFIRHGNDEASANWLEENKDKMNAFQDWFVGQ